MSKHTLEQEAKKNQLLEAMERDLRERVRQDSIRYDPPKLIEKPLTP